MGEKPLKDKETKKYKFVLFSSKEGNHPDQDRERVRERESN